MGGGGGGGGRCKNCSFHYWSIRLKKTRVHCFHFILIKSLLPKGLIETINNSILIIPEKTYICFVQKELRNYGLTNPIWAFFKAGLQLVLCRVSVVKIPSRIIIHCGN